MLATGVADQVALTSYHPLILLLPEFNHFHDTGMHYTTGGAPVVRKQFGSQPLQEFVSDEVAKVPNGTWHDVDRYLPFRLDTSPWTIARECLSHCDGTRASNAVYVLECFQTSDHQNVAVQHLQKTKSNWKGSVEDARRVIYVGKSINLIRRLDRHLNDPGGKGAEFTTVFPPVRVLHVLWFNSRSKMDKAEPMTADMLRDRFPADYVSQPG
mgnify:CR=1 FL=1